MVPPQAHRKLTGRHYDFFKTPQGLSLTPANRFFHFHHILFFQLAKELQDALNCFVVVHLLDMKVCLRDPEPKWKAVKTASDERIRNVLFFTFNPERTIVITNSNTFSLSYIYLCDLQRCTPLRSFFEPLFNDDQVSIGLIDPVYRNMCFMIRKYLEKIFPSCDGRCCGHRIETCESSRPSSRTTGRRQCCRWRIRPHAPELSEDAEARTHRREYGPKKIPGVHDALPQEHPERH
jgi:hypothetical protein